MKTKILLPLLLWTGIVLGQIRNEYEVQPYTAYLSIFKPQYRLIFSNIEQRNDLSLSEKLKLLKEETNVLKEEFKDKRKKEYESKSVELSVKNWCTSKSSGGKKKCGYTYVDAPLAAFYTTSQWLRVEGTNKGTVVLQDGFKAGLFMSVAGKGHNEGTLYATFKYRPNYILTALEDETNNLFNLIIN
ncbi:hypothetical protein [Chryseobacterium sp.]|uniref:hypothetical protein n=1 Tax=Chryseobacterium sp. TaxID=1871047 RepID=UPI003341B409